MPDRRSPKSQTAATPDFRRRFDELERRRRLLIAKLRSLDGIHANHPGYRSAQLLLNKTFRKASLAQRVAVLQSAAWLIDLLAKLPAAL